MTSREVLKVFVASPSDAEAERVVVRECIDAVSAELEISGGPAFELLGWELVRGTARRPQEAINELIATCDYLVAVFSRDWGTDPGGSRGFTSGTEEELFTALLGLGREADPMRDIWLAFMSVDICSPEITELQTQIRERNALRYEEIVDLEDFRSKLSDCLRAWSKVTTKEPRVVDLIPRSGRDVLQAERLRSEGEVLVGMGHYDLGVSRLEAAVGMGGPTEMLALARVLARSRHQEKAAELADRAIAELAVSLAGVSSTSLAEAYAFRADLLRRANDPFEAKQRLLIALGLLHGDDSYTLQVRCRILDQLGLAHHGLKEYGDAIARYEESLEVRRALGVPYDIAQVHVNLARTRTAQGESARATEEVEAASQLLHNLTPKALHANVYLLQAQAAIREGRPELGVEYAEHSLTLNRQFRSEYGTAMSLNVLAQALARVGRRPEAASRAIESLKINAEMGNMNPPPVLLAIAKYSSED